MKNEIIDAKVTPAADASTPVPAASKTNKKTPPKKRAAQPPSVRPGTKKAAILSLLRRPKGVTLKELMTATKWQAHSVRGFLSGTVGKQMKLKLDVLDRNGERAYHLNK